MSVAGALNPVAREIFAAAIAEDRCGELLVALFEGGSATVDPAGRLVIINKGQLPR